MHRTSRRAPISFAAAIALGAVAVCGVADADEPPSALAPPPAPAAQPTPTSGFHGGLFFVRDENDDFRLYVQGRVHVDAIAWLGPGLGSLGPDSALKSTFTLRRIRPEIGGEFFRHWQWQLSVDFGQLGTDNGAANIATRSCTVDPATAGLTCTDREAAVESAQIRPAGTDAFINWAPSPWVNVQVGQYLLPITMENRISDNTTPFLERSLVARGLGAPSTRDIGAMVWGEDPGRLLYYTMGVYNGDGPNRTNADSKFDVVGRVFTRPFARAKHSLLRWAQVGLSGRYGARDAKEIGYDMPTLTTQGGFPFWRPTYKDSSNRLVHILPSAEQGAFAAELYVPINGFDLTSEVVYARSSTREAIDGFQLSPFTQRLGTLMGFAYYVEASYWLVGSRDIIGYPSYGKPLHVDLTQPENKPAHGLQVLAKWEQLHLTYAGAARGGAVDAKTPDGDIELQALTLGLNYWATRHLRVALNYSFYTLPENAITHTLHEIHARVGVQF